ncbi:RNaseH domain-containing protein [Thermopolyspora sp. NPDC052614]|uniref:RNaseH domain-containing protein n=1 Tax=Thermopolyspora sp. NPDC052614 TaxID=3155682 RepID=UPI00342111E3
MTTGDDELHLLAYPLTRELHGVVYLHRFPERARDVWSDLLDRYRDITGSRGNLPYSGLATALRAIGHSSVNLFPTSRNDPPRQMISRRRLDSRDIHDAMVLWEQALLRVPDDEISFSYNSELAELLADIEPDEVQLAKEIKHIGDQPDAANWVYDAATWEVAQQLSASIWKVDDQDVTFRADTDGNLLVWDNDLLWTGHWDNDEDNPSYAALRVQLMMKTLPSMRDPVVVVDPSVSRLSRWLNSSRTAWLAQRSAQDPLLALTLEGRGPATRIERTSDIALAVWARLGGEHLIRPEDHNLTGVPGRLRALVPNSVRFPIGRGVGMYTIRELSRHLSDVLGVPNIIARNVAGHRFPKNTRRKTTAGRDTDLLDEAVLPKIINASGCQRLRILVLYSHQHTRARLQRLLAYHFNRPDLADTGMPEDQAVAIGDHVEILFHHAARLLAHGDHSGRAALLAGIRHLDAPDGTRVMALCETEFDARAWAAQRKQSRKPGSTVADPDLTDAKHPVNRLLAQHNVLAQFITTKPKPGPEPAAMLASDTAKSADTGEATPITENGVEENDPLSKLGLCLKKDHAGHNAVADMLRAAGLIHPRLGQALAYGRYGFKEPIAFVGLHIREQRGARWSSGSPRLSWSLVALIPDGGHWRTMAYQAKRHPRGGTTGWQDYFTANTAFRSHPLPEGKRKDLSLVDSIDTALGQLEEHLATANGYVLLVSGDSSRSLWPLLANKNLDLQPDSAGRVKDRPALPGFTPSTGHRPRAIVRVTSGSRGVPRPVELHSFKNEKTKNGIQEKKPHIIKTTEGLHQLDGARNTWILSNIPRQFTGSRRHSRAGEDRTRWTADNEAGQHTWYAHTATEIVVVGADDDPIRYAVAAARLCDHAIAWDGRTQYPAPLHLAAQMDKDHPDYRRTIDPDEEIELDELNDA